MGLRRFIVHRLLVSIPVLFGVSIITFSLVHLTPTDVVDLLIGLNPDVQPGQEEQLRRELGFDRPVYIQYVDWLTDVLRGDFGEVYTMGGDAGELIWGRLPETIALGVFGWLFALLIAIPAGIYAAAKRGQVADDASRFVALAGISIPNFWLGLMLIAIFAVQIDLWPVLNPQEPLLSRSMLWWLILPGVTIGTAASANVMRIMRTSMAEELGKEYVTAARAKGLPERTVLLKHVLRNSLISVVTVAAFLTANIVAGAVVVEVVFGWPGLGHLFVEAIYVREVNLIMGITLLTGAAIILANLLADIVYAILDPRIRDEY
ncbi:ABC transporter permease [Natrarchaeobius sp. A-rgal3]|uniref:ABC transporter permease n=1 Tax=Natrarchaeobius versutus TaxID=1679078 RepID=UPI00351065CF